MSIQGIDNWSRIFPKGRQDLARNAAEFQQQIYDLCEAMDADFAKLVRHSVLKLFISIVNNSPVDKGAYRASHGIANGEVSEAVGIVEPTEGSVIPPTKAMENASKWTWNVGDGKIILFNNVPYAETIEFGGYPNPPKQGSWDKKSHGYVIKSEGGFSKQAPKGVYSVGVAEFNHHVQKSLAEIGSKMYSGG